MIIKRSVVVPILILLILFTSIFVSLNSIFLMPQEIMGGSNTYVLTSSTDRNPLRSNLDINLAYGLENMSYITAVSPEIFLFSTVKGEPVTLRGVIFSKFLNIEDGRLVEGAMPKNLDDALVGEKIFNFLKLKIGEKLTISGSFQPSIAIINITGVFRTGTSADDEILISLPTAQKLAGLKKGDVSIIRFKTDDLDKTRKLMDPSYPKFTVRLNSTAQVYVYDTFNVTVTIENIGSDGGLCHFELEFQNESFVRDIYVNENVSFNITLKAKYAGNDEITASVKNDVLFYSTFLNISIMKNPVIFHGKVLTHTGVPTTYTFETRNNTKIENATLKVYGSNYSKTYHFNYSVNIIFPHEGLYTLYFQKEGFENKTIEVKVFKKVPFENLAKINPQPLGKIIPVQLGENITVISQNNSKIYYSIDGGTLWSTNSTIPIPKNLEGRHVLEINVVNNWSMANGSYVIYTYNSSNISIFSQIKSDSIVYYNSSFKIDVWSEIPLKNITVSINKWRRDFDLNQTFKEGISNYSYNISVEVKYKRLEVIVYAQNILNSSTSLKITPKVIYSSDITEPEIIIGNRKNLDMMRILKNRDVPTIEVWSGESFTIRAVDNLNMKNLSVYIFNTYFNASSENSESLSVTIPTIFPVGNDIHFIPEGIYEGVIVAIDSSGNKNTTVFYVVINNTGEKIPPIIRGPSLIQFNSPGESYIFKAFDNVGIRSIEFWENDTLIKNTSSTGGKNLTVYLNYSDVSDGLHHITIRAYDINNNSREMYIVVLKNYTDTEPPIIEPLPTSVWSGSNIIVEAIDNVKVKKLSVYAFEKWFNGSSRVVIPTMYEENNTVRFIAEGNYTLHIQVWDIFDNYNSEDYEIEINNTGESLSPIIVLPNITKCTALDTLTFLSYDNVEVYKMWIEIDNISVVEEYGNNLSVRADTLGYGILNVYVFSMDVNNNIAFTSYKILIVDNILPQILNKTIKIWGGNTTNITFSDNIGIKGATLWLFDKTWRSEGERIEIQTVFKEGDNITFIPEGTYYGMVTVEDFSGNVNSTTITLIINNSGERNPPIIVGNAYNIISENESAIFRAYDNVRVIKMWWMENESITGEIWGDNLTITAIDVSIGLHFITVYAEDTNGNIATFQAILEVKGIFYVDISISLEKEKITVNERGIISIEISNGPNPGRYNATLYLDDEPYYIIDLFLSPYTTQNIVLKLPYLDEGKHTITLGNQSLTLTVVENPIEKLPIDIVLKYNKNLNVTGGKNVIYKGFQISEGNFVLVIYTLISIAVILVALGMYSSLLKGMKNNNIAILRTLGASNRQITKFALEDTIKYLFTSIIGGIFLGYLIVILLEKLEILRAFGHRLIIYLTPSIILGTILIGFGFLFFITLIILKKALSSKVIHLISGEKSEKIVTLEDVLNEG